MKKFFLIFLLVTNTSFAVKTSYEGKEIQYKKLFSSTDFWINSPLIMDNAILFFYKGKAKKVLVSGDFNGWSVELKMQKKKDDLWVLYWDKRLPKGKHFYKYIVDDIWTYDENNTNYIIDKYGDKVSFFILKDDFIPYKKYPLYISNHIYRFRIKTTKYKRITLVGDFNDWNPYKNELQYKGEGVFETEIKIAPGIHAYCFVADGEWIPDPDNLKQFSDQIGNIINIFYAK